MLVSAQEARGYCTETWSHLINEKVVNLFLHLIRMWMWVGVVLPLEAYYHLLTLGRDDQLDHGDDLGDDGPLARVDATFCPYSLEDGFPCYRGSGGEDACERHRQVARDSPCRWASEERKLMGCRVHAVHCDVFEQLPSDAAAAPLRELFAQADFTQFYWDEHLDRGSRVMIGVQVDDDPCVSRELVWKTWLRLQVLVREHCPEFKVLCYHLPVCLADSVLDYILTGWAQFIARPPNLVSTEEIPESD